jgi:L-rhamnose mutarotase
MATIADDPTTQRWWEFTNPCQQPVDSALEGEWWAPAEEVFHTDGIPGASAGMDPS